jgi:hypothetical protein
LRRFTQFAALDWSGQAVVRPKGIALAQCDAGCAAPELLQPPLGWSRQAVLDWLLDHADRASDLLIGIDFSPSLPFEDQGAYFPGWRESPGDARTLWELVDRFCADEPHLSASGFALRDDIARHYRRMDGRRPVTGEAFTPGLGRLRLVERLCRTGGHGPAISSFNLVGAAQVGKSSLTGMRLLHRLDGRVPIWPFDPVPDRGPLIVEIYTTIAARTAGAVGSRSKIRDAVSLEAAITRLGSERPAALLRYDDHATDAILTAVWLRAYAGVPSLWSPAALTPALARTEGWTFGVP